MGPTCLLEIWLIVCRCTLSVWQVAHLISGLHSTTHMLLILPTATKQPFHRRTHDTVSLRYFVVDILTFKMLL